jgi:hypoxanthine phosphoribosyltransferase
MMKYVREPEYHDALRRLAAALEPARWDAVVGLKRSGLFPAVFLSHQLRLAMYADSEVESLPAKFERVLLVDAVVNTGKSIAKVKRALLSAGKTVTTAVLYKENDSAYAVDVFLERYPALVHFFYERLAWQPGANGGMAAPL